MKIKSITSQYRRDFTAIIVCEGCDHEETLTNGYDDSYYHNHVIPNMKCSKCDKPRKEIGVSSKPMATKYPDWMQV